MNKTGDATHYLECFEPVGKGKKRRYFMLCKYIGLAKDGKSKIEVHRTDGRKILRYTTEDKLINLYEKV